MKNLILILSVLISSITVLNHSKKKDLINILYHSSVKDKMIIVGEYTADIQLDGYHSTLTNKFQKQLNRHYKTITTVQKLPETGKVLVIRAIEPKLMVRNGKTKFTINYNYEVWQDRKQINKFSDTVFSDYPEENLNYDKVMALISFTNEMMIKKIAEKVR